MSLNDKRLDVVKLSDDEKSVIILDPRLTPSSSFR